jgi:hypothetical protein
MSMAYVAIRRNGEYVSHWPSMAEAELEASQAEDLVAFSSRTHRAANLDNTLYVVPLHWHPDVPMPYKPGSLRLFVQYDVDGWQCLNCRATTDEYSALVDVQAEGQLDRVTWKVSANVKETCNLCGAHEIYIDPTWLEDQS